jgi:glycosyltransferase involved in cell wall biosynthesis
MRVLLAYPKHIGNTGWYLERALMSIPSIYTISIDLRNYRLSLAGLLKKKLLKLKRPEADFVNKMAGPAVKFLVHREFTSEPPYSIDIEPIFLKLGDFDLLIHVDGAGTPIIKNVEKVPRSVLWALDTHIKLKYLLKIAPFYDYVFCAQKRDVEVFKEVNSNSYWLPYAADPTIYKPYDVDIIYDVAFVGNLIPGLHDERIKLLNRIKRSFNTAIFQNVWLDEAVKIYSSSKLVFNRSINGDLNMRVFEAIACGRLLITDAANGILDIFEDKNHLVIYNDSDLEELIKYYLEYEEERNKIANAGMEEIRKKHTYDVRLKEMLRHVL